MTDTEVFRTLSAALLGDETLPAVAAAELAALLPEQLGDDMAMVLARWSARAPGEPAEPWIEAHLWNDPASRAVCEAIMMAWLFGTPPRRDSTDPRWVQRWFEGRFWSHVLAHIPGLSGGYFGHWAYPPES